MGIDRERRNTYLVIEIRKRGPREEITMDEKIYYLIAWIIIMFIKAMSKGR
jgi:hypothetical protein